MAEKTFIGARIESDIVGIVDKVARESGIDRTAAIKLLVSAGWKNLQLSKAVHLYGKGRISLDKAAKMAGLTVGEMMEIVTAHGIKSEETIEEYREGIKLLLGHS